MGRRSDGAVLDVSRGVRRHAHGDKSHVRGIDFVPRDRLELILARSDLERSHWSLGDTASGTVWTTEPLKPWNLSSNASARICVVADVALSLCVGKLAFVREKMSYLSGGTVFCERCSGCQVPVVKSGHLGCSGLLNFFLITIFLIISLSWQTWKAA